MKAGTRLAIGAAIVTSATAYMSYVGASSSWQYYLTVDECLSQPAGLSARPIRISGEVLPDSLFVATDRQRAEFQLEGTREHLHVHYVGRVPDNLAEARQVVVEGRLQSPHTLHADNVLTRCASKYAAEGGRENSDAFGPGNAE